MSHVGGGASGSPVVSLGGGDGVPAGFGWKTTTTIGGLVGAGVGVGSAEGVGSALGSGDPEAPGSVDGVGEGGVGSGSPDAIGVGSGGRPLGCGDWPFGGGVGAGVASPGLVVGTSATAGDDGRPPIPMLSATAARTRLTTPSASTSRSRCAAVTGDANPH